MSIVKGMPICWGADPRWATLPIINLPGHALRVKRRIRQDDAATVFVRTPGGVQRGVLRVTEDTAVAATSLTALWNAANVTYP